MILLGNLLLGIAGALNMLLNFFQIILIIRCCLSFVSPDPRNPIVQFLYSSTEPMLTRVRQYVKPIGMFDLSPIIVFMFIYLLQSVLVNSLASYGTRILNSAGAV